MSEKIILTVPARLLQPGDHTYGYVVSSRHDVVGIDGETIHHVEFKLVMPYTDHFLMVTAREQDLDYLKFPLTKRGDEHSPNRRNEILGVPPVPPQVYVAPEPIAIYSVGTKIDDVKEFDRGMKIFFACPNHPESAWLSKDPYCSSIFPQSDSTVDCGPKCAVRIGDYVVTHTYKPTRNS